MAAIDDLDDELLRQVQVTSGEPGAEEMEEALRLIRRDEGTIDQIIGLLQAATTASPLVWAPLAESALLLVRRLHQARADRPG